MLTAALAVIIALIALIILGLRVVDRRSEARAREAVDVRDRQDALAQYTVKR